MRKRRETLGADADARFGRRHRPRRGHSSQLRWREGDRRRRLRRQSRRDLVDHRAERRRQELDAERDQRLLSSVARPDLFRGQGPHAPARGRRRPAGLRPHVPEHRALQGDVDARQHHDRALAQDQRQLPVGRAVLGVRAEGGDEAARARREDHRLPRDPGDPQDAGGQAPLRPAEAGRARPRAGDGAQGAAARRADGRDERRGEGGHGPLHPRRQRPVGDDDHPDRARHGRGDGHLALRRRDGPRCEDRRGLAHRGQGRSGRHPRLPRARTNGPPKLTPFASPEGQTPFGRPAGAR